MRYLSQSEAFAVSGGFLSAEHVTYAASSLAPVLANVGYQLGFKALGISNPSFGVTYLLLPTLNVALGGAVNEFCKQYFSEKAS